MLILRVVSAALAVFLIVIIAWDVADQRRQPGPVLEYQKGIYLGQADTVISEETRIAIRQRGVEASAW